jgi:kynurenine 3-monooxygenase
VELRFDCRLTNITPDNIITVVPAHGTSEKIPVRAVIGADGAYSSARACLLRLSRIDYSQQYIEHGYKELTIAPGADGSWLMSPVNALHIWPRHQFMMIALPNPGGSWTCTMFAPFKNFEQLDRSTDDDISHFFQTNFPDAVPLMPDVVRQYRENPTGALVGIKVNPWNFEDKVVIMGDAAHAIVPFFGQVCVVRLRGTLCPLYCCVSVPARRT